MRPVVVESPLGGPYLESNWLYAQACMKDSLMRGEAPYLSHLLYPQVLDDHTPEHRELGMKAGVVVSKRLLDNGAGHVYYVDLGMSRGMQAAQEWGYQIEIRLLGGQWESVARSIARGDSADSVFALADSIRRGGIE